MIIVKGLMDFNKLKRQLFNIIVISLCLCIVYIFSYKINNKIDKELNNEEVRTILVEANDIDALLRKYSKYIEKSYDTEEGTAIVLKSRKYTDKFTIDESYYNNIINVSVNATASMDGYKLLSGLLAFARVVMYVILFIMIVSFSVDYFNKSYKDFRLYIMLGFRKSKLLFYNFLFLGFIYSLIYLGLVLLTYLLIKENVFNILAFGSYILSVLLSILILNNLLKKSYRE